MIIRDKRVVNFENQYYIKVELFLYHDSDDSKGGDVKIFLNSDKSRGVLSFEFNFSISVCILNRRERADVSSSTLAFRYSTVGGGHIPPGYVRALGIRR